MSNKLRYCLLCKQYDGRTKRSSYTRICTIERETKLREGYRHRYNGQEVDQPLLNQLVHQKCYNKIIQYIPSNDESISSNIISTSIEENPDDKNEEEDDQTSIVQSRSRATMPYNVKYLLQRIQRACVICHSYKYSYHNRMRQVVSNFMANKLAEGFLHRYKRPYGKSLLDAYLHDSCYRKLYASYRYHPSRRSTNRNRLSYPEQNVHLSLISPHETRSRSNVHKSAITTDESANSSIEELFSTPFSMSIATINPNIERSARSCLFRPCLQRLTPEEIELYTKRNPIPEKINEDNTFISDFDQLPIVQSSITLTSTTTDSMIDSNQDNDVNTNEQDNFSSSHSTFNKQQKIYTTAEIRHRYSKPPPLSKPANPLTYDHIYLPNPHSQKPPEDYENLYQWLIEELKSSGHPISMTAVLAKYRELTEEVINPKRRESFCRIKLRIRLEKLYPNQFVFIIPNRRDGTFVALNDIEHYLRSSIKTAQKEKEKSVEASILSSIIIPPTPKDYQRETCETIMNGIRKIRLYIRDAKQIDSSPSLLMQNFIGLITASEKQFDRVTHDYDFYRMIDENLFEKGSENVSHKLDKTLRNMSLASDLISARHDSQTSQKHYLLADKIAQGNFHCSPRQVITLLNRYGHTCSYKSYQRMKKLIQQTTSELGERFIPDEDKSSDSELDLMEL